MEQIDVVYKLTERYPDNFQIALTASGMSDVPYHLQLDIDLMRERMYST